MDPLLVKTEQPAGSPSYMIATCRIPSNIQQNEQLIPQIALAMAQENGL
jgi:hypothetical protein